LAVDFSLAVREAVVAFLRTDGPFTALQPVSGIYGQMQPPNTPYPFTRCGVPNAVPLEYSCVNGSTVTLDVVMFAEDEAECHAIAHELVTSLDGKELQLTDSDGNPIGGMYARWTGGPTGRDPEEESVWRAVRTFDFEASL
jgi:hypothetical protein